MDNADELSKLVGIQILEVVVLVNVSLEVIEELLSLTDNQFPIALTNANNLRRTVAHLPIEEVVLALTAGLAQQRRAERDAVKRPSPALP